MSETFISASELGLENEEPQKLNTEFRTKLGSATEYGKPYTKEILRSTLKDYFQQYGASGATIFYSDKESNPKRTTQADIISGNIISFIPTEKFRRTKETKLGIDEFENLQINLITEAVHKRILEIDEEISNTGNDAEVLSLLIVEKNLINKLL